MTRLHTTLLATLLAISAAPALAGPQMIDLPRLDFPPAPETSRATPDVALPLTLQPQKG